MRNSKVLLAGLLGASLIMSACSQGSNESPTDSAEADGGTTQGSNADQGETTEAAAEAPAPFDGDGVQIAIVQQSGQGDYFQQYLNGTRQQVEALGGELSVFDAQGDNATQASQLDQAIAVLAPEDDPAQCHVELWDGTVRTLPEIAIGGPTLLLLVSQACAPCTSLLDRIDGWIQRLGDKLHFDVGAGFVAQRQNIENVERPCEVHELEAWVEGDQKGAWFACAAHHGARDG